MPADKMGKQRPKKKDPQSEDNNMFKPPIHRIAANAFKKNAPIKKDLFKLVVPTVAAQMRPNLVGSFVNAAGREYLSPVKKIKHILDNGPSKLVIMDPKLQDTNALNEKTREFMKQNEVALQPYNLNLDYDYFSVEEILTATLPPEIQDIPSGFTTVGHICHMNLRPACLPYKYHIGSVVLSKTQGQGITTVINKLDIIDSIYRNFQMEVIAGEENFIVTQPHLDCTFTFDFSKVYWNTRLETEHRRLVEGFAWGEGVCDVFAGVGPFALPAGRRKCFVLANDLNPDSYGSMTGNIVTNKLEQFVKTFNEDGREFIRKSGRRMKDWHDTQKEVETPSKRAFGPAYKKKSPPRVKEVIPVPEIISHFVMNLPATAIEFLDAFRGLYKGAENLFQPHTDKTLPMIHVYCFQNPSGAEETILQEIRKALGFEIQGSELSIHNVRNVSPNKDMYCVTFRLPGEVAFATE